MDGAKTIVLVGCTGNGKSATGNSILGRKAFRSKSSFRAVTTACQLRSTKLQNGQTLKVIDTPGLFDSSTSPEIVEKEIIRCIEMAKDGIHAILIVLSLGVRFSKEQAEVVDTLKHLFGTKILDYLIVAFTNGDRLKEYQTLDGYLTRSCPEALKELLEKCGNRRVVFNNKLKAHDKDKKDKQLQELLTLIDDIMVKNGGKPYTRDLMVEFKDEDAKMGFGNAKQAHNEERMQERIAELVHKKLIERNEEIIANLKEDLVKLEKRNEEMINKLRQELERARREGKERTKIEEDAKKNAENEIRKLKVELQKARREIENRSWSCVVL